MANSREKAKQRRALNNQRRRKVSVKKRNAERLRKRLASKRAENPKSEATI